MELTLMSLFKSFEEIESWQKARELTKDVYRITNNENINKFMEQVIRISQLISGFIRHLRKV
jgi:hypothetical protein